MDGWVCYPTLSSIACGVIAVGCPVDLDFTVTLGIVSSPKSSAFEVGAVNLKGSYIQTDAALNLGNSGGPLIGINTMVRTNTEVIGFAIQINRAMQIYEVLIAPRKAHASGVGCCGTQVKYEHLLCS